LKKYLKAASNAQQRIEPSLQGVAGDINVQIQQSSVAIKVKLD
jgi:hypothetical protein